jgi:hypothetical protein
VTLAQCIAQEQEDLLSKNHTLPVDLLSRKKIYGLFCRLGMSDYIAQGQDYSVEP